MNPPRFAPRIADIRPFQVMELLRRARELQAAGHDIIHMEVGEPDFPTPAPIIKAATSFLANGHVHYTPALGLPELREAVAQYYEDRYRLHVEPARIVITPGASGALLLALAATTSPGGKWLIPDPGYPSNRHMIRAFEGTPVPLPVDAQSNFQPTLPQIEKAWGHRTEGLILATPSNPTGTVLDAAALGSIYDFVSRHEGQLIVDEIYQGLIYGAHDFSALGSCPDAIIVNSFSKYFGMTGWRLGWLVVPQGTTPIYEKLAQHFFISPSTVAQAAALAAFLPETQQILEERRQIFAKRRMTLLAGLASLGITVPQPPTGAFYVYANINTMDINSGNLAHRLLEHAGVACTPGHDFGIHNPDDYLRLAYTTDEARITEALSRIKGLQM